MRCPACGTRPPFWLRLAFLCVVGQSCATCGQDLRINSRGFVILITGALATIVFAVAAEIADASPLSPLLVAAFGILLTAIAADRFGKLVKRND